MRAIRLGILLAVMSFAAACSKQHEPAPKSVAEPAPASPQKQQEATPNIKRDGASAEANMGYGSFGTPGEKAGNMPALPFPPPDGSDKPKFRNIKAEMAATSEIKTPGSPGDLKVWVGDPDYHASFPSGMNSASAVIPTLVAPQTIKVTPDAPDFNVTPDSACQKFDPSGTTTTFQLTPKHAQNGTYRVGATIGIYGRNDCQGTPVPKDAKSIYVKVRVVLMPTDDMYAILRQNIARLMEGLAGAFVIYLIYRFRRFLGLKSKEKDGQ